MKDCPRCGLVNPPVAEVCDCGYSFARGDVKVYCPKCRATDGFHRVERSNRGTVLTGLLMGGIIGWSMVLASRRVFDFECSDCGHRFPAPRRAKWSRRDKIIVGVLLAIVVVAIVALIVGLRK
jgi:uncharacterized OB-fold protein